MKFVSIADVESNDATIVPRILEQKADLLFVAFGSPTQEKWIDQHRAELSHTVCVGVGGAFDMFSGRTPRATETVRKLGLEWLYRLITQPWRWRRQMKILQFIGLVLTKNY
jgi:N-acetylglucosaminyldiphosphoundecaprenol N-acetyl-beta-D-mannosaminyltransferase